MMGTKLLTDITVRVIMFERCVEYDGYKTTNGYNRKSDYV
jgi:hypothetical protein